VFQQIIWNDEPGGNIEHIEKHGLTVEDVEHVLANFESQAVSRSSGHPVCLATLPMALISSSCMNRLTKTRSIP
jgi:hypothetical protein